MRHSSRAFDYRGCLTLGALLAVGASQVSGAQESWARRAAFRAGVVTESWRFATPLPSDSSRIDRISQTSIPIGVAVPLGGGWAFDISGAYAMGSVRLTDSTGARQRTLDLAGPTDIKLRLVGRLLADALVLHVGLNAPTGLTKLGATEVEALRLIAAPPLRMPSPTLGSGFGATAGLVVARQAGGWALAAGGSYETRASYSPIEAAIGGTSTLTDLDPSDALHLTLGADRLIGPHRLSLLSSYDVYGEDHLTLTASNGGTAGGNYKLGPTMTVLALLEFGVPGMQEMSVSLVDRYRSSYRGIDGLTAVGSSGNSVDARVRARFGAPRRMGWLVGGDLRFDSGLGVDNTLATAAMNSAGGMVGLSIPVGAVALEPALQAFIGSIDTGRQSSRATGLSFSVTLTRR